MLAWMKSIARRFIRPDTRKRLRRCWERHILAPAYLGTRYRCLICGWSFRKLLPGGYNARPNACCPRCGAFERHRTLCLYLTTDSDSFGDGCSLLHVSPESCIVGLLKSRFRFSQYVTLDLFLPRMDMQCSVTDIPAEDGQFDVVICSHVLQEVPDDQPGIDELARVLKTGGTLYLQLPVDYQKDKTVQRADLDEAAVAKLFGKYHGLRFYGRDCFDRLSEAGFDVRIYDPEEHTSPEEYDRYRLKEKVIICRKR